MSLEFSSKLRGAGLAAALLLAAGSVAVPAYAKDGGAAGAGAAGGAGGETAGAGGAGGTGTAGTAGAGDSGTAGAAGASAAAGDAGTGTDAAGGSESGGGPSPGPASGRGLVGPTYEGSETGATTVERPTNLYGVAAPADRQPLDEDQLESRLRALGFSEVGQLRERAGTFQADAQWRGEDVVVVVDPNTGALSYEDDAVARD